MRTLLRWFKCTVPAVRLFLALAVFSSFSGLPQAAALEVKVGLYENPPKIFTEKNGAPAGIFVDIIEEIARREGWSLKYVHGTWPQCLENLELGKIDLMPDVAYSGERAQKYDFCRDSVISNWAVSAFCHEPVPETSDR